MLSSVSKGRAYVPLVRPTTSASGSRAATGYVPRLATPTLPTRSAGLCGMATATTTATTTTSTSSYATRSASTNLPARLAFLSTPAACQHQATAPPTATTCTSSYSAAHVGNTTTRAVSTLALGSAGCSGTTTGLLSGLASLGIHVRHSSYASGPTGKFTILDVNEKHKEGLPITMITAYDAHSAALVSKAGIDMILVGDSASNVVLGRSSTATATMEEMLHHCRAVAKTAGSPMLVGDMPLGSFEASDELAVTNAIRFLKEGDMEAVKLEGGKNMADRVRAIARAGVPVVGHIGLTPQMSSSIGGYRVQGRTAERGRELLEDALALQEAGCFAIVLEALPMRLATYIVSKLDVPTIGIGAGPHTSGQVLVWHDMLGLFDKSVPKFCKVYANLHKDMLKALVQYKTDVESGAFPSGEYYYRMANDEFRSLIANEPNYTPPSALPAVKHPLNPDLPTIAVVGTGAVGCATAGLLAEAGVANVWMVGNWIPQLTAIARRGLVVEPTMSGAEPFRNQTIHCAAVSGNPARLESIKADIVIVAVKGNGSEIGGRAAVAVSKPGATIIALQNGLGAFEQVNKGIKFQMREAGLADSDDTPAPFNIVQGVVAVGARLAQTHGTVCLSTYPTVNVGEGSGGKGETDAGLEILRRAKMSATLVDDIDTHVWRKLAVNAVVNPVTALLRAPNGSVSHCNDIVHSVVSEVCAVATATGVSGLDDVDAVVTHVNSIVESTSSNTSSMLADINRRVATEIEMINGAVVRMGESVGVATPVNKTLYGLVRAAEASFGDGSESSE